MRRFDVSDESDNDHRWSLEDSNSFYNLLLIYLCEKKLTFNLNNKKNMFILERNCTRHGLPQWLLPNGLQRAYGIYLASMHSA